MEISLETLEKAIVKADELMKADNGHNFVTILKTRCIYCGKSPKVKTKCPYWFQTYLDKLRFVLFNEQDAQEK